MKTLLYSNCELVFFFPSSTPRVSNTRASISQSRSNNAWKKGKTVKEQVYWQVKRVFNCNCKTKIKRYKKKLFISSQKTLKFPKLKRNSLVLLNFFSEARSFSLGVRLAGFFLCRVDFLLLFLYLLGLRGRNQRSWTDDTELEGYKKIKKKLVLGSLFLPVSVRKNADGWCLWLRIDWEIRFRSWSRIEYKAWYALL